MEAHEQFGGHERPKRQMDRFKEAVHASGFVDVGYIGLPYTWDNKQQEGDNV